MRSSSIFLSFILASLALNVSAQSQEWSQVGGSFKEQFYSPLTQVNQANVGNLELAWSYDLDSTRGQEASPLIVDGKMYLALAWNRLLVLDALSGDLLWQYDPSVNADKATQACCDAVTRGVAIHKDSVFMATLDGRLIRLNRHTGEVIWSVMTIPDTGNYTITGAPRVGAGLVFIGNGGAEYGARGYVTAYDIESGKQRWRFFTVPGDPAEPVENSALIAAMSTWTGSWWKLGGGGTVWDAIVYDEELDQLYIGVGNGGPHNPAIRSPEGGDNLYLSSIVALNPRTGEYLWHFQQTPGDAWDFTATQPIVLADLEIQGRTRKVLMQAPKNGFFYVLDRETGEYISAAPYARVNWAEGVDSKGRPMVTDEAKYYQHSDPVLLYPGPPGAHSWQPMAYDPGRGLVFIPASDLPFVFNANVAAGEVGSESSTRNTKQIDTQRLRSELEQGLKGYLVAWDPIRNHEIWRYQMPSPVNGGILATASGLVFKGGGNGELLAFDSGTGEVLWSDQTFGGIIAAPSTYEIDGEQFLTVVQGWGGGFSLLAGDLAQLSGTKRYVGRVLTYKLHGGQFLLPSENVLSTQVDVTFGFDDAVKGNVEQGEKLYAKNCRRCHGGQAISGGTLPDLRKSLIPRLPEAFDQVVIAGALRERGMPSFASNLKPLDVAALRAYILDRVQKSDFSAPPMTIHENMVNVTEPGFRTIGAYLSELLYDDAYTLVDEDWAGLSTLALFMLGEAERMAGQTHDALPQVRLPNARIAAEFRTPQALSALEKQLSDGIDVYYSHLGEFKSALRLAAGAFASKDRDKALAAGDALSNQCLACHTAFDVN